MFCFLLIYSENKTYVDVLQVCKLFLDKDPIWITYYFIIFIFWKIETLLEFAIKVRFIPVCDLSVTKWYSV